MKSLDQFLRNRWLPHHGYAITSFMIATMVCVLNERSQLMSGILPFYEDYAATIRNGLNASSARVPTFPMWGYGWVLWISSNRVAIFAFQCGLACIATWCFVTTYCQEGRLRHWILLAAATSLPWFSLQATLTPYGIAGSLVLLSLAFLLRGLLLPRGTIELIGSGVLFGLSLNFRSDFFLMPIGLALIAAIYFHRFEQLIRLGIWGLCIVIMMIPWMLYTLKTIGTARVTSTNGGHVLFVGLGQLPGNPWGITASDDDPLMHKILRQADPTKPHSCSAAADLILRDAFYRRVKESPGAYFKKTLHSLKRVTVGGAYPGEYLTRDHWMKAAEVKSHFVSAARHPIRYFKENGPFKTLRLGLLGISYGLSLVTVGGSTILIPFTGLMSIWRRDLRGMLVVAVLCYSTLLQCCTYQLTTYSAGVMVFHIVHIGTAIGLALNLRSEWNSGHDWCHR